MLIDFSCVLFNCELILLPFNCCRFYHFYGLTFMTKFYSILFNCRMRSNKELLISYINFTSANFSAPSWHFAFCWISFSFFLVFEDKKKKEEESRVIKRHTLSQISSWWIHPHIPSFNKPTVEDKEWIW